MLSECVGRRLHRACSFSTQGERTDIRHMAAASERPLAVPYFQEVSLHTPAFHDAGLSCEA